MLITRCLNEGRRQEKKSVLPDSQLCIKWGGGGTPPTDIEVKIIGVWRVLIDIVCHTAASNKLSTSVHACVCVFAHCAPCSMPDRGCVRVSVQVVLVARACLHTAANVRRYSSPLCMLVAVWLEKGAIAIPNVSASIRFSRAPRAESALRFRLS